MDSSVGSRMRAMGKGFNHGGTGDTEESATDHTDNQPRTRLESSMDSGFDSQARRAGSSMISSMDRRRASAGAPGMTAQSRSHRITCRMTEPIKAARSQGGIPKL